MIGIVEFEPSSNDAAMSKPLITPGICGNSANNRRKVCKYRGSFCKMTKLINIPFQRATSFCNQCTGNCRRSFDGTLDSKRYAQVDGVMKTSSAGLSSANSFSAKFAKFTKVLSVLGDVLQVLDAAIAIYRFNPYCIVLIKNS